MDYEKKYKEALERADSLTEKYGGREFAEYIFPELAESEDERIRKFLIQHVSEWIRCIEHDLSISSRNVESEEELAMFKSSLTWLEKQKENPKTTDSIPSSCTSDAKYEDRWHKVTDSLPDNGRLVLAKDCLGNVLLARYDGENWEVNVYDNEDHYCHNSISKWCEIPSEKQKEQKPVDFPTTDEPDFVFSKQEYESHPIISTDTTSVKPVEPDGKALLYTADKSYQIGFRDGVASVKPA